MGFARMMDGRDGRGYGTSAGELNNVSIKRERQ
jgi:hypothetical protein